MDRELSRRDFFATPDWQVISLSALMDLAWQRAASASTPKIGGQLIGKLEGPTTARIRPSSPRASRSAATGELVKAGTAVVKERIGEDPLVIKPGCTRSAGYGGTSPGFTGTGRLVCWCPLLRQRQPRALGYDRPPSRLPRGQEAGKFSDGDKTLTINLRRG